MCVNGRSDTASVLQTIDRVVRSIKARKKAEVRVRRAFEYGVQLGCRRGRRHQRLGKLPAG